MHGMHRLGRMRPSLRARRAMDGMLLHINWLRRIIGLRRRVNILRRGFIRLRGVILRWLVRHNDFDVNLRLGGGGRGKSDNGNACERAKSGALFQNRHDELLKRKTRFGFIWRPILKPEMPKVESVRAQIFTDT